MEDWKQFCLSVLVCSLSCSIAAQLVSGGKTKALLRLVCGVMLALTILRPLSSIDLDQLPVLPELTGLTPEYYIAEGEKTARDALESCIKSSCETYILDKARSLGADITVQVSLDDEGVPAFALIQGDPGADAQRQLEKILITDLGISKENQQWEGKQESSSS